MNNDIVALNETVHIPFNTFNKSNASVTFTGTVTNLKIYPAGSVVERTSAVGCVLNKDIDAGVVGVHVIDIDTSDNTDVGFYKNNTTYNVVLTGLTIDAETVNVEVGSFTIDNRMLCAVDVVGQTITDADRSMFETDTTSAINALQGKWNARKIVFHTTSSLPGEESWITDSKQYGANELLKCFPLINAPVDGDLFYLG
ncbi:MAG: hypothetical protein JKX85_11960 [Phycisphaeraceae bacterium]|nr:hypothetical protein [Phycisphaeraceae bacterium]